MIDLKKNKAQLIYAAFLSGMIILHIQHGNIDGFLGAMGSLIVTLNSVSG